MNELEFTRQVRRHLEASTERLPYKVTHRLEQARMAALARVPAEQTVLSTAPSGALSLSGSGGRHGPSLWKKALLSASPAAADPRRRPTPRHRRAGATWSRPTRPPTSDAAMLEDDVPLSAYADRGFGVFIKNTGQ